MPAINRSGSYKAVHRQKNVASTSIEREAHPLADVDMGLKSVRPDSTK